MKGSNEGIEEENEEMEVNSFDFLNLMMNFGIRMMVFLGLYER
jgi:hypothetical protein